MNAKLILTALLLQPSAFASEKVHLQWAICENNPSEVLEKLGYASTSTSKEQQITYYDTKNGLVTRRDLGLRVKLKKDKMVSEVKVRFANSDIASPKSADCVWDRYGNDEKFVCAEEEKLEEPAGPLWSKDQMNFVGARASLDWGSLVAYGPYQNSKWDVTVDGTDGVFDTVDVGRLHLMELEIETKRSKDNAIFDKVTRALEQQGITLCPIQEGKTARLLRSLGALSRF